MSGTLKLTNKLRKLTLVDVCKSNKQGKYDAL